jgi:hypothetical protein
VVLLCAAACESKTEPTPPPSCQTNMTATVEFVNNNGSGPVDVIWNGAVRATNLAPGATAGPFTVTAAGAQYTLTYYRAGTQTPACGVLTATPIQCQLNRYGTCAF